MSLEDNLNIFNVSPQPPQQPEDIIALPFIILMLILITLIPLSMFLKYHKHAVRVKQPMLLLSMMLSVACWLIGGLFSYRIVKSNSVALCHITCIWLMHYGILGFVSLLIVRVFNLIVLKVDVSIASKASGGSPLRNFLGWVTGLGLGMLMFTAITVINMIFTLTNSVQYDPVRESCFFSRGGVPFRVAAMFLWTFALGFCSIFNLRLRRELRESTLLFIGVLLMAASVTIVMAMTIFSLHYLRGLRIIAAALPPLFFAAFYMIAMGGKTAFKIITCRSRYFDQWLEKFQKNSVEHMLKQHLMDSGITDDEVSLASEDEDEEDLTNEGALRAPPAVAAHPEDGFVGG